MWAKTTNSGTAYDSQYYGGGGDGGWYYINRDLLNTKAWWHENLTLIYELREDDSGFYGADDIIGKVIRTYPVYSLVNAGGYSDFTVSNSDGWGGNIFYVSFSTSWSKVSDYYYDYFYDYVYGWTSVEKPLDDNRLTLNYQWVSQPEDIPGLRPKFETYETEVPVVTERQVTKWRTELIY